MLRGSLQWYGGVQPAKLGHTRKQSKLRACRRRQALRRRQLVRKADDTIETPNCLGHEMTILQVTKFCRVWATPLRFLSCDTFTATGRTTQDMFAVVCAAVLLSALAAERIGIHAIFGDFLLGTVIPHDSVLARDIRVKCEDLVVVLLLPVFFVFTGMRTQIGLLHGTRDWLACILIIGVASLGKFGGSFFAARWTGSEWREAASLGVLMNTRGLIELIVLNVGLNLGVLSPALFTMFVFMAVVTTLVTTPILHELLESRGRLLDQTVR